MTFQAKTAKDSEIWSSVVSSIIWDEWEYNSDISENLNVDKILFEDCAANCQKSNNVFSLNTDRNCMSVMIPSRSSNGVQKTLVQSKINQFFKTDVSKVQQNRKMTSQKKNIPFGIENRLHLSNKSKSNIMPKSDSKDFLIKEKKYPAYKIMLDSNIAIDAFNYGIIPDIEIYILTHFHYDHYIGLTKHFMGQIYCSFVTANLLIRKLNVSRQVIHPVPLNQKISLQSASITLLDANHCPGSVMVIIEALNGNKILHTGDFRVDVQTEFDPILQNNKIDILYLDTTYCNPNYTFPHQNEIISFAVTLAKQYRVYYQDVLIICGKEKIFKAIASALGSKIWADENKRKIFDCLEDYELSNMLTENPSQASLHVMNMTKINTKFLESLFLQIKNVAHILALKPTGWEYDKTPLNCIIPKKSKHVSIYGLPYSEHSNFNELKQFVKFIKPQKIISTVYHSKKQKNEIDKILDQWMKL